MARIKYQEALGLEVKRGRLPAGLPLPLQITIPAGKDLNEYLGEGKNVEMVTK